MPRSINAREIEDVFKNARIPKMLKIIVRGETLEFSRPFPSPLDWRDQIIYFIMIDRFNNPAAPPKHIPYDDEYDGFQGGTLNGIRGKLDYLAALGVSTLWLTPIFKNPQFLDGTYHGYGIQDFLSVDPRFGTDADLRALVNEAHARGIYVILDVVINHAGDVFVYQGQGAEAPFRDYPYEIFWRRGDGTPNPKWKAAPQDIPFTDPELDPHAAVFPDELRDNRYFRRQGRYAGNELMGDFASLKEMVTEYFENTPARGPYYPVRDILIRAYQYAIAHYDIDGFRIDTLKYVERDFALVFGNALREYALSIGKKNFFTYGEVYDSDEKIALYTGRFASDPDYMVGVDSALDFPLFFKLAPVAKGLLPPAELVNLYEHRKAVHRGYNSPGVVISSHGEASRFFVTFLDNHDQKCRIRYSDPAQPDHYDHQVSLAVGCLFSLQGIPCLYYGTEQGLKGAGQKDLCVREALWGKPEGFDRNNYFYKTISQLAAVRSAQPALRYGRQFFRPISGNNREYGISGFAPGVIAFSRILNDMEVVILANTQTDQICNGFVIVDFSLNQAGSQWKLLYSNYGEEASVPGLIIENAKGSVTIHEIQGNLSDGPVRVMPFSLQPMEIQIIGQ